MKKAIFLILAMVITTAFVSFSQTNYAVVTGSNVTTTSQSFTDITPLAVALDANTTYEFNAVLECGTSTTDGNQYAVNFTSSGATIDALALAPYAATYSVYVWRISAFNTGEGAQKLIPYLYNTGVTISGTVTTGANSGDLVLRHLKLISGTATVFTGSYLKVTKIQ